MLTLICSQRPIPKPRVRQNIKKTSDPSTNPKSLTSPQSSSPSLAFSASPSQLTPISTGPTFGTEGDTAVHPDAGKTPKSTVLLSTGLTSDTSGHDEVLESLRRRRLELKQQREQSLCRKTDASLSSTVSGIGTDASSTNVSSQSYVGVSPVYSSGENILHDSTYISNRVDCPRCGKNVQVGLNFCNYCNQPMYCIPNKADEGVEPSNEYKSTATYQTSHVEGHQSEKLDISPNLISQMHRPKDSTYLKYRDEALSEQLICCDTSDQPLGAVGPEVKYPHSYALHSGHHQSCIPEVALMSASAAMSKPGMTHFGKHHEYFHNERKTDTDVDANPDFLHMKEEEQRKQQTYQPPCDHEASYQNPKKVPLATVSSCKVQSSSSCGLEDMLVADQNKSEHKVCLLIIL